MSRLQKEITSLCSVAVLSLMLAGWSTAAPMVAQNSGWSEAQRIETNTSAGVARVASDAQGNAISLWVQSDGAPQQYGLWSNRYVVGQGWGTPQRINDYIGQADWPSIAMNSAGEALVVWSQYSLFDANNPAPIRSRLWASQRTRAGTWSTPAPLSEEQDYANFATLALDEAGNGIVTYLQVNPTLDITNVYARRYSRGGKFAPAQLIQKNDLTNAGGHQVAVNSAGQAMVIWYQYGTTPQSSGYWNNRFDPHRGWLGAKRIPLSDATYWGSGSLAMDDRGNAMMLLAGFSTTTYAWNIYASNFDAEHGWGTPQLLQSDPAVTADQATLSMNKQGVAMVVWRELPDVYSYPFIYQMRANQFIPKQGWLGSTPIGIADEFSAGNAVSVGLDARGDAVAVWLQTNPAAPYDSWSTPPLNVYSYHYDAQTGWDSGQLLQLTAALAGPPVLAVTPGGDAMAVWSTQDQTSGANLVWASHYNAAKPRH
jgi:hypothetical protein